jgi:octaprenyl-diphosphate synthase
MAFQLVDDLLDYTADEATLGKPVLKDLEEGNVTLPLIRLLERVPEGERDFIRETVQNRDFNAKNKRRILELVRAYETLDDSRNLALEYAERARLAINGIPASAYRESLFQLPKLVLNRQK